eukprot:UN11739
MKGEKDVVHMERRGMVEELSRFTTSQLINELLKRDLMELTKYDLRKFVDLSKKTSKQIAELDRYDKLVENSTFVNLNEI